MGGKGRIAIERSRGFLDDPHSGSLRRSGAVVGKTVVRTTCRIATECTEKGTPNGREDGPAIGKTDLGFARVDIDVDRIRSHLQKEEDDGKPSRWQEIPIGLGNSGLNRTVLNWTTIHEEMEHPT